MKNCISKQLKGLTVMMNFDMLSDKLAGLMLGTTSGSRLRLSAEDLAFLPCFKQKLKAISIKPWYYNEIIAETIANKRYLSSQERDEHQLFCLKGLFYDKQGHLLNGPIMYVIFPDGRMFGTADEKIHHSHLSAGLDLIGAGMMYFSFGQLITISNESGHYRPMKDEMVSALSLLYHLSATKDFLFEDHCAQDPNLPLNGIRYYRINDRHVEKKLAKDPLLPEDLVKVLYELTKPARDKHFAACPTIESSTSSDKDDLDNYYTDLSKIDFKVALSNSILEEPGLVAFTCFRHIHTDRGISRFTGVTRQVRQLRATI